MQIINLVVKDIARTIEHYLMHALFFAIILLLVSFVVKKIRVRVSSEKYEEVKCDRICVKDVVDTFLLNVYCFLIFDITILSRDWFHYEPFSDVLGGWSIRRTNNGRIGCDAVENIIFFIPYGILLYRKLYLKGKYNAVKRTVLLCLCTSILIEVLQLITGAGTLQIADLVYNTIGGAASCAMCKLFTDRQNRRREEIHNNQRTKNNQI